MALKIFFYEIVYWKLELFQKVADIFLIKFGNLPLEKVSGKLSLPLEFKYLSNLNFTPRFT